MSGVVTFYSYKGGSGRTLALANIASFLARYEKESGKILVIDWDLDSPGLHRYFQPYIENSVASEGLIELFEVIEQRIEEQFPESNDLGEEVSAIFEDFSLDNFITPVNLKFQNGETYLIDFIPAGRLDENYAEKVRRFGWDTIWDRAPEIFTAFANYLSEQYEWILIDSRTGFTLTSMICSALMPSKLVMVFTPNSQSLEGIKDLAYRATWARQQVGNDDRQLSIFPLPSRIETAEETKRRLWRFGSEEYGIEGFQPYFEQLFRDIYGLDQEPDFSLDAYFNEVQIQHTPRYAYGEEIAALVEQPDRFSLARSFETFAKIFLDHENPWRVGSLELGLSPEVTAIEANSGLSSSLRKANDWLGALIAIFKAAKRLRQVVDSSVPSGIRNRTIERLNLLLDFIPEQNRLEGHGDDVLALDVISTQGRVLIASASRDHTFKLWQKDGTELLSSYSRSGSVDKKLEICDVAISPDGSSVAVITNEGQLELVNRRGRVIFSTVAHISIISAQLTSKGNQSTSFRVCFAADGQRLFTSSSDEKDIKIWSIKGYLEHEIKHDSGIVAFDFNATKNIIAFIDQNKNVKVCMPNGNFLKHRFSVDGKNVECLDIAFDPLGTKVAISCSDGTVRIWNFEDDQAQTWRCSKGSKKIVYSSAFSPSGTYLATACENGSVGVWELSKSRFRQKVEFEGHNDEVRAVKFLAEDIIVSGGGDSSLRIWKLKSFPREQTTDLDLLLEESCLWLDDYLRTNRNLDLSDRYLCTDIPRRRSL